MKKVLYGLAVVVILVVVGIIVLVSGSGDIIKAGVERYGPGITGGNVTLESADVSIFGGSLSLENLVIGNPSGFETPNAFTLGEIAVTMDMDSLGSSEIHINDILIDSPEITYELTEGQSNIEALQRNIEQSIGVAAEDDEEGTVSLIIDNLVIRNAKLNVTISAIESASTEVTLPDINVSNIGQPGDPVSPGEAATIVMTALTGAIAQAIATDQIQGLINSAFGDGDGIIENVGEGLRKLFGRD